MLQLQKRRKVGANRESERCTVKLIWERRRRKTSAPVAVKMKQLCLRVLAEHLCAVRRVECLCVYVNMWSVGAGCPEWICTFMLLRGLGPLKVLQVFGVFSKAPGPRSADPAPQLQPSFWTKTSSSKARMERRKEDSLVMRCGLTGASKSDRVWGQLPEVHLGWVHGWRLRSCVWAHDEVEVMCPAAVPWFTLLLIYQWRTLQWTAAASPPLPPLFPIQLRHKSSSPLPPSPFPSAGSFFCGSWW